MLHSSLDWVKDEKIKSRRKWMHQTKPELEPKSLIIARLPAQYVLHTSVKENNENMCTYMRANPCQTHKCKWNYHLVTVKYFNNDNNNNAWMKHNQSPISFSTSKLTLQITLSVLLSLIFVHQKKTSIFSMECYSVWKIHCQFCFFSFSNYTMFSFASAFDYQYIM